MRCPLMDNKPEIPYSDDIAVIESFVMSLYSVACTLTDGKQVRHQTFAQSSRTFEYLPPTKTASVEHVKETRHTKRDMCVWPIHHRQSTPAGYQSGLPSLEP